ncbi:MAG: MFS transporter [Anaerolineae bacterium]
MSENNSSTRRLTASGGTSYEGWKGRVVLFLASQGLSLLGSMLVQYAIIWYITLTTKSGAALTIATLVGFAPQIAISLFAGVWDDRYNRKALVIGADLLTAASTLVLLVLFTLGYRELWLLYVVSAVRSIGAGIQAPAVNALVPQLVPGERLMKVNSVNNTIQPIIMFVSPILSGALLSLARLERIFFVDIGTAVLAVSLLLLLKTPPLPRAADEPGRGYLSDLKAGLAYIGRSPSIRTLFAFFGVAFFLVTPAAFLTPLLVTRTYGGEVWRLTANEITFFGGSIIGGFVLTAWGGFKNRFITIALSCLAWAALFAGMGLTRNFWFYLALMVMAGMPMPFWNASATTLLQELTLPEMQGRVFGVQQLIGSAVMPLGMLIFGPAADIVAIELLFIGTSVLMVIPGIWLYVYGRRRCPPVKTAAPADSPGQVSAQLPADKEPVIYPECG